MVRRSRVGHHFNKTVAPCQGVIRSVLCDAADVVAIRLSSDAVVRGVTEQPCSISVVFLSEHRREWQPSFSLTCFEAGSEQAMRAGLP